MVKETQESQWMSINIHWCISFRTLQVSFRDRSQKYKSIREEDSAIFLMHLSSSRVFLTKNIWIIFNRLRYRMYPNRLIIQPILTVTIPITRMLMTLLILKTIRIMGRANSISQGLDYQPLGQPMEIKSNRLNQEFKLEGI